MIKTVMFDLGGVLVRTEDHTPRKLLAEKYGISSTQLGDLVYRSESGMKAMVGEITTAQHWEFIDQELGLPDGSIDQFEKEFWGGDHLDQVLIEFIAGLRSGYQTALLSNAWDNLRHLLEDLWEVDHVFDRIFVSAEIGAAKPDPAIYQFVFQELQRKPEEIVFIDDFEVNVTAARELGMQAILFRSREQALMEIMDVLDTGSQLRSREQGI
jgi:putative hydrolase of the HAD superfamily